MDMEKLDRLVKLLAAVETLAKFPTPQFNNLQAKVMDEAKVVAKELEDGK